jgi:hypothetical protein
LTCNGNVRGSRKAKKIIIIQFEYYSIMWFLWAFLWLI